MQNKKYVSYDDLKTFGYYVLAISFFVGLIMGAIYMIVSASLPVCPDGYLVEETAVIDGISVKQCGLINTTHKVISGDRIIKVNDYKYKSIIVKDDWDRPVWFKVLGYFGVGCWLFLFCLIFWGLIKS